MKTYSRMVRRTTKGLLILAMLCECIAANAVDYQKNNAVYNKLKFLDWLVVSSPTRARISESSDAEAIAQLKDARKLLAQAQQSFDADEMDAANEYVAQGLKLMVDASRKVKDIDRIAHARSELYQQLKQQVSSFADAFERVAVEKSDSTIDAMLDRKKLAATLKHAEVLYTRGELALANQEMKQAADMVEVALSGARKNDVLLHELSFKSPEDEYAYEKQRNESYVMLIGLLQDGHETSDASRHYVEGVIAANTQLRDEAASHASKGDYKRAIGVLEKGTDKLSRALRMSGASF
jgi:hypothetical protein